MAEICDSQLIQRAANGDADAFTELVRRYRDMVYGYCYHRTGSFEDARDLAQETFLRAYTRLSQLRDDSRLSAWLRTIAGNLCTRWFERRRELPVEEVPVEEPHAESPHAALVREALASLPENERLAVVLHYVNGYSYDDIAGFLEISKDAVRGRLHRGREQLRTEMLRMTEDTFKRNRLDEKFVIETVGATIQEAMDAYNMLQDKGLSRKKTEEAAALLDGVASEQIKDPVALGHALLGLASREGILKQPELSRKHTERARRLFEQAGNQDGIESIRASEAYDLLNAGDFAGAHKLYCGAADYWLRRRKEGHEGNDYEFLAATRALESLGLATKRSQVLSFLAGVSWFVREDTQTLAHEGVAFGFTDSAYEAYARSRPGPPPNPTPLPLVLIRDRPEVGDNLRFVNPDKRSEESVLESLSETITTPAGVFADCARIATRVFPTDRWEGEPVAYRKLWLAPDVGIVRASYHAVGERADTSDLVSFHVDPGGGLLPLRVGNWWKWRWIEGEEQFGLRTEICKSIMEATPSGKFLALQVPGSAPSETSQASTCHLPRAVRA